MSAASEAETLRNQIKYLTDLISNAKEKSNTLAPQRSSAIIKPAPKAVQQVIGHLQVKGHQVRGHHQQVRYLQGSQERYVHLPKTSSSAEARQPPHFKQGPTSVTGPVKSGKYVWTKQSGTQSSLQQVNSPMTVKIVPVLGSKANQNLCSNSSLQSSTPWLGSDQGNILKVVIKDAESSNTPSAISLDDANQRLHSAKNRPEQNIKVHCKNSGFVEHGDSISKASRSEKSTKVLVSHPKQRSSTDCTRSVPSSNSSSVSTDESLTGAKTSKAASVSARSCSSPQSDSTGKSVRQTTNTCNVPPMLRSTEQIVPLDSQSSTSLSEVRPPIPGDKSADDKDVILFSVRSLPLDDKSPEENRAVTLVSQNKLSVIPSFLRSRLNRTSKDVTRKVDALPDTESSTTKSKDINKFSEHQVPMHSGVHSKKLVKTADIATALPCGENVGANKTSNVPTDKVTSVQTASSSPVPYGKSITSRDTTEGGKPSVINPPGVKLPVPSLTSYKTLLLDEPVANTSSIPLKNSTSDKSAILPSSSLIVAIPANTLSSQSKSSQRTVSSPIDLWLSDQTKLDNVRLSKSDISWSSKLDKQHLNVGAKSVSSSFSLVRQSSPQRCVTVTSPAKMASPSLMTSMVNSPPKSMSHSLSVCSSQVKERVAINPSKSQISSPDKQEQPLGSQSTSPRQLSSQQPGILVASPCKTSSIEKVDSRKDAVLQLSEKLAKAQAEIKQMTRNITNGQVTMKSIAAIKSDKSATMAPSPTAASGKFPPGQNRHRSYAGYRQGFINDKRKEKGFHLRRSQTSPSGIKNVKFPSQYKSASSSGCVIFDKKYSLNKKIPVTLRKPDIGSSSAQTPSKTQVVAKVIKSKYRLRKITPGMKTPPPYQENRPPKFHSKTFPRSRGFSSPSRYSYRGRRGAGWRGGHGWGQAYGRGTYSHLGKQPAYPGPSYRQESYARQTYSIHRSKGLYYNTGRGSYHTYSRGHPKNVKSLRQQKSRVIFDKKYVLKRLQHDEKASRPSSFKLDKRTTQISTVGSPGVSSVTSRPSGHASPLPSTGRAGIKRFVVINGMLYRSSSNSLVRTSPTKSPSSGHVPSGRDRSVVVKKMQTKSMKLVTVRGVPFQMDASGKTLRRVHTASSSSQGGPPTTINRLDIGGVTFVRNSQGVMERLASTNTRVLANRVIHKSIAAATARYKKINTRKKQSKQYCLFFNRFGKCKRGDNCPYVHDPEKIAVCTRFLRGTCQMTGCPFSHKVVKEKMPVCSYFLRGVCIRDNCPYLHVKVNKNAAVCQDFVKGFCPLGEKCKKKHTLECPKFTHTGQCPVGKSCPLIHKKRKSRNNLKRDVMPNKDDQASKSAPDPPTLKRTAAMENSDTGVPFKMRKLPPFISLDSGTVTALDPQPQTLSAESIRIKPKL